MFRLPILYILCLVKNRKHFLRNHYHLHTRRCKVLILDHVELSIHGHGIDIVDHDVLSIHHFFEFIIDINNPHGINLPSSRPQWRLFSVSFIHFFATGSAMRVNVFYRDELPSYSMIKFFVDGLSWYHKDHNRTKMSRPSNDRFYVNILCSNEVIDLKKFISTLDGFNRAY